MLDTMMGACWDEVVIRGTCSTALVRSERRNKCGDLTEDNNDDEGWEGRVATPPVVSAEVTRLS